MVIELMTTPLCLSTTIQWDCREEKNLNLKTTWQEVCADWREMLGCACLSQWCRQAAL